MTMARAKAARGHIANSADNPRLAARRSAPQNPASRADRPPAESWVRQDLDVSDAFASIGVAREALALFRVGVTCTFIR